MPCSARACFCWIFPSSAFSASLTLPAVMPEIQVPLRAQHRCYGAVIQGVIYEGILDAVTIRGLSQRADHAKEERRIVVRFVASTSFS